MSEGAVNGHTSAAISSSPPLSQNDFTDAHVSALLSFTPAASYNTKERVMQLLDCLKDDFGLVYSPGGRLNRRSSTLSQKIRPLHDKRKNRLMKILHRPCKPCTDDWMDGSEGEKIALELNGTSWVWSALEHESEWACSIDSYNKIGETEDVHIEFQIQTLMSSALYNQCLQLTDFRLSETAPGSEDEQRVTVLHRFNDFKTLFGLLVAAYPYLCIPPLPPNRFAKLSEKLTLYRRRHLELWLRYLAMHPILSKAKYIHDFLFLNGKQWAQRVDGLKASEKNILGCVKASVAYPGLSESSDRIGEIEMNTRKLEKAIDDIGKLFVSEQKSFSEDLSATYACYCAKLNGILSLLQDNPEEFCVHSWNEIFCNAARIFNARASSLNSKTEHFDEINSILEEFHNMVKQLRKLASTSTISKKKLQSRETILKELSMEAEFHWVLKNQISRLALELADFCESHAELLDNDASLCREAVIILRKRPRYNM